MSVGRLPPAAPQLPAVRTGAATPAASDAQKAFFAAALGQAAPAAPVQAQAKPPTPPAAPAKAAPQAEEPEPTRYLRPGSFVDIKV